MTRLDFLLLTSIILTFVIGGFAGYILCSFVTRHDFTKGASAMYDRLDKNGLLK